MEPLFQILKRLSDHGVDFVLIGGMAAIAHGAPYVTLDVDVCTTFDEPNVTRILAALKDIHPYWRSHPKYPPLATDPADLQGFKNLYLHTDLGNIDLLGELPGVCSFAELQGRTVEISIHGRPYRVLDLDTLLLSKRRAGRNKDKQTIYLLEAVRKMREKNRGIYEPPAADPPID